MVQNSYSMSQLKPIKLGTQKQNEKPKLNIRHKGEGPVIQFIYSLIDDFKRAHSPIP